MKYSDDKNVLILLSLLKAHNIKKIVTSPGVANITFVASVQIDPYFEVYSSVDERSAAYIACGLAEESGEPVVISCTGATASRNYMPALTEAFYRKLPILAVTSARDIAWVGQNSPQQIDRSVLPRDIARYSLHLPTLHTAKDETIYTTLINKAILELTHNGGGPVHINLTNGYTGSYTTEELPKVRKISRIDNILVMPELPLCKIAVFVGAHSKWTKELTDSVEAFCLKHNAVVLVDHISNYRGKYAVFHNLVTCQQKYCANCMAVDLMINIGHIHGTDFEGITAKEVWRVNIDGEVRDTFGNLTMVFQMDEQQFFEYYKDKSTVENNVYVSEWENERKDLMSKIPELPFSNIWVGSKILPELPAESVLHFGIQNSLRSWNLTDCRTSILGYCNTGGFGIDGCVSSLIGASLHGSNKLYFGVVGDLAFFYDMNSIGNRHVGNNVRLIVVNNGRGQQFRNPFSAGGRFGEDADRFIAAAGHNGAQSHQLLKHLAEDLGFEYMSAENKEEFNSRMDWFTNPKPAHRPYLFEIFTQTEDESKALELMCTLKSSLEREAKDAVKKMIGSKATALVSKLIN